MQRTKPPRLGGFSCLPSPRTRMGGGVLSGLLACKHRSQLLSDSWADIHKQHKFLEKSWILGRRLLT
jgi:hypothetical protein